MTTIAYNHKDKEIAIDSRIVQGDIINSDEAEKFIRKGGITFLFTGATCDFDKLVDAYFNNGNYDHVEASAIFIQNGVAYQLGFDCELKSTWHSELTCDFAIGSGKPFALAAMDFGKTAKQAVKYASKRDIFTGGKVRVFKVE